MTEFSENDRLARLRLMVGDEGVDRLRRSFAVVVGLGAVGSYSVEGLARSGVGRMRLVDFDTVHPSNINRQIFALSSTVGRKKCELALARVKDINPDCEAEGLDLFCATDTIDAILAGKPDIVIDAIDSLGPKSYLIAQCLKRGIPHISSMGAALRTDPSLVRFGKFSEVKSCPLARRVKDLLRHYEAEGDFDCAYSVEPVTDRHRQATIKPLSKDDPGGKGRARAMLGSLPTVTGMFGLVIAHHAIRRLLGGNI